MGTPVDRFSHVWLANYLADALELEGAMKKTVDISVNGRPYQIPSITSEVITPETATAPSSGRDNDYIVYALERDDRNDLPYKKHRTVSLSIYTHRQESGIGIVNAISEYFGDSDAVCRDLDLYQVESGGEGKYKFLSVEYKLLTGPEQINLGSEGGLFQALVLIAFSYTYPMNRTGIST